MTDKERYVIYTNYGQVKAKKQNWKDEDFQPYIEEALILLSASTRIGLLRKITARQKAAKEATGIYGTIMLDKYHRLARELY